MLNSITLGDADQFIVPKINIDNGKLDLFIIKSKSIFDYLITVVNFLLRRPTQDPNVEYYPVYDDLIIRSNNKIQIQADGELIGYPPVEIKIVSNAVNIIVPEGI